MNADATRIASAEIDAAIAAALESGAAANIDTVALELQTRFAIAAGDGACYYLSGVYESWSTLRTAEKAAALWSWLVVELADQLDAEADLRDLGFQKRDLGGGRTGMSKTLGPDRRFDIFVTDENTAGAPARWDGRIVVSLYDNHRLAEIDIARTATQAATLSAIQRFSERADKTSPEGGSA